MTVSKSKNHSRTPTVLESPDRPPRRSRVRPAPPERSGLSPQQLEEIRRRAVRSSYESITVSRLSDGRLIDVNERFLDVTGHTYESAVGKTTVELGLWKDPAERSRLVRALRRDGEVRDFEVEFVMANGAVRECLLSAELVEVGGDACLVATVRDVTDVRKAKEALRWYSERLQDERRSAAEKEAALNQVLLHLEEMKSAFRSEVTTHVVDLLEPVISRLRNGRGRPDESEVDRLEQCLRRIVEEDVDDFHDRFTRLTIHEQDICAAIKDGMSSKEIADRFGVAVNTVHKHRQVIRRKLRINNKDVNLATYLRSRW